MQHVPLSADGSWDPTRAVALTRQWATHMLSLAVCTSLGSALTVTPQHCRTAVPRTV